MITRADYNGSPHIGVFCLVNDNHAFVSPSISKKLEKEIKEKLEVDVIKTTIAQSGLIGVLMAANNKKAILPSIIEKEEKKRIEDFFSEVIVISKKSTAVGNLIAMNDRGMAISTALSEELKKEGLKIAGTDLIGSAVYVNNIAFIAHRDAEENEIKKLEKIFKVPGGIGTVNMGDPFVKSAIIGNKKGLIVSTQTTGPELNRIDDIFIYD